MSNEATKKMLRAYEEISTPTLFLSGMFLSPPENFFDSETVEIDIARSNQDVAIVVQSTNVGYRDSAADKFTNKEFKPPIYKERVPIDSAKLIQRQIGRTPFDSPDYRGAVIATLFKGLRDSEDRIKRAMELQAKQVLQTGIVDLVDTAGTTLYTIDYKPKATHFPNAGTGWDQASPTMAADLEALAGVIIADGKVVPDQLLFGEGSWGLFIKDTAIQAVFENRRIDLGTIAPTPMRGDGAIFQGVVTLGNYRFDVWTYAGRYDDPQTGNSTKFIDDDKVIMRASGGRLDAVFGAIPNIGQALGLSPNRIIPELPPRLVLPERGLDLNLNVWMTADGEQLFGGVGTRPLMIPTAIDTYGCLDTLI